MRGFLHTALLSPNRLHDYPSCPLRLHTQTHTHTHTHTTPLHTLSLRFDLLVLFNTHMHHPGASRRRYVRLSEEDERVVCCLLATAEFCRDTTEGLAGALAKDVRSQFADRVDFADEEAAFQGVARCGRRQGRG